MNLFGFGKKPKPATEQPPGPAVRTVLIVDDNPPFRGMLKSMLKMRGYNPIAADSPADGLKLAAEVPIDAALVDFDMPGMNGLEFCKKLLEQNRISGREVPTWIMTGELHPEVAKRIDEVGALLVVRKPFNTDEMCSRMEAEFSRRSGTG